MPIWVEWVVFLVGVAGLIFSIVWNARGDKRATTHDFEERVKNDTRINMKLDDISSMSREIKDDVSSMRREIQLHNDRLIKVEESVKSAHKRVDTMESRLNKLGGD